MYWHSHEAIPLHRSFAESRDRREILPNREASKPLLMQIKFSALQPLERKDLGLAYG